MVVERMFLERKVVGGLAVERATHMALGRGAASKTDGQRQEPEANAHILAHRT